MVNALQWNRSNSDFHLFGECAQMSIDCGVANGEVRFRVERRRNQDYRFIDWVLMKRE